MRRERITYDIDPLDDTLLDEHEVDALLRRLPAHLVDRKDEP